MKKTLSLVFSFVMFCYSGFSQDNPAATDTLSNPHGSAETSSFDTDGLDDEESTVGGFVPGLLHSSRDVFSNNTSYAFGIAYFKARGLDSKYQTIAINGLEMESLVTGRAVYAQWGGLNRVFRWPENVGNLDPVTFNFGDIGGSTNYSTRASNYRHQFHANYSLCNRNYNNRIMLTYATGLMKNGWAFAASASTRFGSQLSYVDGSSYTGFAYFFSAEKRFNSEHALNLSFWGSPTSKSLQSNSTQEVYDLTGDHYYNSNWGWYDGKKRNARIRKTYEPV
ncbi:MAG: TonB-dependent receptor, partial [Paludibacteraceae bacterium]|nr:TonB-dependent receptor [Paludibacteraceae bacterium]